MKKILLLLVSSLTMPAFASNEPKNMAVEFLIGSGKFETSAKSSELFGNNIKDNNASFGIRGSYSFNENIAFEAGLNYYGEASDTILDRAGEKVKEAVESSSANIGIKGTIPFDNGISLNARFGFAYWQSDYSANMPDSTVLNGEERGTDLYYGFGSQYMVGEQTSIGLEYSILKFKSTVSGDYNGVKNENELSNLTISIGYHF